MSSVNKWFVPGESLFSHVTDADIQRYLGPGSSVKSGLGIGEYEGVEGHWVTSQRKLTVQLLRHLKSDSARRREVKENESHYQQHIGQRAYKGPLTPRESALRSFYSITAEKVAMKCQWQTHRERFLESDGNSQVESIRSLGKGAFGEVDEVKVLGEYVPPPEHFVRKRIWISAIKRVRDRELELVKNEIDNLKRAVHPHIVKLVGSYREEWRPGRVGSACILTHPVGRDLETFFEGIESEGTLGSEEELWVQTWFGCLVSALDYLHRMKIQHKDIKPRNIIHLNKYIYFTDFGSSRLFESGHTSTEAPIRATRLYWAPEHSQYDRHGNESDVFSLGLVFVELLTVLSGRKVWQLHEFVDGHNGFNDVTSYGPQREYWRVVGRFDDWFPNRREREMYTHCIEPMLVADRKNRPTTQEVWNMISERQPWQLPFPCPCKDFV